MNKKFLIIASVAALTLTSVIGNQAQACGGSRKTSAKEQQKTISNESKDIIDTALSAGKFNTLATALTKANLIETLKGPGPFTVFAPTDEAFKNVPEKDLQALLDDKAALTKVLTYHVVPAELKAAQVVQTGSLRTVEGSKLPVTVGADSVKIGNATIKQTDIQCQNGVIHIIDTVLLPPVQSADAAAAQ